MELAYLILQGVGAVLLAFIMFTFRGMRQDLSDMRTEVQQGSREVSALATLIANKETEAAEKFVRKDDWHAMRDRVHDLTNTVTELRTIANMRRGA